MQRVVTRVSGHLLDYASLAQERNAHRVAALVLGYQQALIAGRVFKFPLVPESIVAETLIRQAWRHAGYDYDTQVAALLAVPA